MKRKIFSLLIALCIVLTFVVATSAGENNQAEGTTKYKVNVNVVGGWRQPLDLARKSAPEIL